MFDIAALSIEKIVFIGGLIVAALVVLVVAFLIRRRLPRRLKTDYFKTRWIELQKLCAHPQTWPQAIIEADNLLATALKKKFPGRKSVGERLVSAQKLFSDNDAVWFAHKLRNKLEQRPNIRLKQDDVKEALLGVGQALKDLGAL